MHADDVTFLLSAAGQALLNLAQNETARTASARTANTPPTNTVQLVSRLRAEGFTAQQVSAVLTQLSLRAKAGAKFRAFDTTHQPDTLPLLTPSGLEQATRWQVAARTARHYTRAGIGSVSDLGCGIGANALGFAAAGLRVQAVELDHLTALVARHNLAGHPLAKVHVGDAATHPIDTESAFFDPARRTGGQRDTRRLVDPADYTPSLTLAFDVARRIPTGVKLGPGFDREHIPEWMSAEWVSVAGQVVELGLYSGALATAPGARRAVVAVPAGRNFTHAAIAGSTTHTADGFDWHELSAPADSPDVAPRELGEYLYEPDGAIIRARLIGDLARANGLGMLDPHIAYLTGDRAVHSPFLAGFRVRQVLPFRERELKTALKTLGIGTLEIKKRGVDIDPATLRTRLSLRGPNRASLIVSRIGDARLAIIADRL